MFSVQSLRSPANEEGGCPQVPVAGILLGGTTLTSRRNSTSHGRCWPGKFCACVVPSPVNTHGSSYLSSNTCPEEIEKSRLLLRRL
ncbi:hypothetical protein J0S82_001185 [Galemys pyrenaicus]|uniref:Uncharacterized protein n=1 Tax=Galemys pyrenaicus TaxID=202257 RepID=A0A8J5ZQV5_GALPY|nr:hypothetical protein J0S82_001185 [Galemys pyrenaicus]